LELLLDYDDKVARDGDGKNLRTLRFQNIHEKKIRSG